MHFSRFESHASKLFRLPLPPVVAGSKRVREHTALDYRKLKLFFLTVLWRSSVASHDFFRHVSLGPHEKIMQNMLLREDPGPSGTYPVMIFLLNHRGVQMRELMAEPTPVTYEHRRFYRFVMAGFAVMISVSRMASTKQTLSLALSPTSPVRSFDAELEEFAFLKSIPSRITAALPA
jgi:hypothetical protein